MYDIIARRRSRLRGTPAHLIFQSKPKHQAQQSQVTIHTVKYFQGSTMLLPHPGQSSQHGLCTHNKAVQLALEKPGVEVDDSGVGQLLLQAALQIIGHLPHLPPPLLLFLHQSKSTRILTKPGKVCVARQIAIRSGYLLLSSVLVQDQRYGRC